MGLRGSGCDGESTDLPQPWMKTTRPQECKLAGWVSGRPSKVMQDFLYQEARKQCNVGA